MKHNVDSIASLPMGFSSVLSLSELNLPINLGITDDEMRNKQEVSISFKFFFKDKPLGCKTDNIKDTVCYHEISNLVKEYCENKEFRLLEYICYGLYNKIKAAIPPNIKIWIRIEKCNPPIEQLVGSTSFEYTDVWE
jgi:dihydroneopterin aldolase